MELGVFVNEKTDHFNHEKPSTRSVFGLEINHEKPTIFTSKNRPVAKMGWRDRILVLDGG
jgi:hypothetical protein